MEHSHPAPTPDHRKTPIAAKEREACIAQFRHAFANDHFSDGRQLTSNDRSLLQCLLTNLQHADQSGALDLSDDDRDLAEFANPEMLQKFSAARKQIGGAVTALKLPVAMLSFPGAWITHLPELQELGFGSSYMGRAMQLHSLSKLKKVHIGNPVNLKFLSIPAGCVAQADADFPVPLDKNFQAKKASDPLIERGFLTIAEYDKPGVMHSARKYRLSEPYWQRGSDALESRWENLNSEATGPRLVRPLACAELAALWLNNRYAYRTAKQLLLAQGKKGAKPLANAEREPAKRFSYDDFATVSALLNANQRLSLSGELSSITFGAPRQHFVRSSDWPNFVREQFKTLLKGAAGAFRLFALVTVDHAVAVEFLVQPAPDGAQMFVLTLYDPNVTKLHKRQLAHDLSEVAAWRLGQLCDDLSADQHYQPMGVTDPTVLLAEFRAAGFRNCIRGEFPDKNLTLKIVKLWPSESGLGPIDPACHLLLLEHRHFDMWRELVAKSLAPLSEQDRIRYLAVPTKDDNGRVVSQLLASIKGETWEPLVQLLSSGGNSPEKVIDTLIAILGAGTCDKESIQTSEPFEVIVSAIHILGSGHTAKPLSPAQIVKLLSVRPAHEDGIGTLLKAMVFLDIGEWLEQLKSLKDSKLIGASEIRQIMDSHATAHKGGWQGVVQQDLTQHDYRRVHGFYMALAALGFRLDAAGHIVEMPAGQHASGADDFRERLSKEFPDPHAALAALALALCDPPPPDAKDAMFHAMRSPFQNVYEMFNAVWALSHTTKDQWEFIATELCAIKSTSAATPRYLLNEVHESTQFAPSEEVADAALRTLIGIQKKLSELVADGMPAKILIRICASLIDPATPDDTDLNDWVFQPLNLHWNKGALSALSTPGKAHA